MPDGNCARRECAPWRTLFYAVSFPAVWEAGAGRISGQPGQARSQPGGHLPAANGHLDVGQRLPVIDGARQVEAEKIGQQLPFFQAVREKREKKLDLAAGFFVPTQGMLSILVCAGMLMAAGGALLAWDGVQRGDVVSAALGGFAAVAAVCLLLAMSRWRREERCGGLLTMPALLCVVWLLVTYRQYADYPVLEELYIQILAIAAFTYGFYQTAAYDFALGSRRPTRFVLPAAVVLGMTALADDLSLGLICLYVGCTVVLYAFSLLERPAGPD